jgi:hypothetical protein
MQLRQHGTWLCHVGVELGCPLIQPLNLQKQSHTALKQKHSLMNYHARQHEMCLCHVGGGAVPPGDTAPALANGPTWVMATYTIADCTRYIPYPKCIITESSDMHYLPFHLHPNPETNVRTHVSLNSPP